MAKQKQTASLKGGSTFNTTCHPYDAAAGSPVSPAQSGTSIFDPVLCELGVRWFSPPGGSILDPFAGGSVRGIVSAKCGRHYLGVDLRPEQIAANRAQAASICAEDAFVPEWVVGDSLDVIPDLDYEADFILSCPPYGDLEVYSDNPSDLSTMAPGDFLAAYREIIGAACSKLRENRFAMFVVGDYRDRDGFYSNFPAETTEAFRRAGLRLYNEAILVTVAGSLPLRAGKQFSTTRKLGKALRNGTPVLTPTGWRAIEALSVGDDVIAGDGTPTKVVGVYPQGERDLSTVTFHDGAEIDADAEHLWEISSRTLEPTVMTTAEIVRRFGEKPGDPRPAIPTVGVVQFPPRKVSVDPYLIGLLLGDGGLTGNTPIVSTADPEIVERLPSLLPSGMVVKSRGYDYRLVGAGARSLRNPLTVLLRPLGMMGKLAHEKSIPADYLWNEPAVRIAVLRGLMDTDGSVTPGASGCTEFQSSSRALAEDVMFLARSLGARASIHQRMTASGRPGYRVRLRGGPNPFLLARKAEVWAASEANRTRCQKRKIASITPSGRGEATCIAVAHPSKLFVAGDFVVTHNTHQNVLIYCKGDPRKATAVCGDVDVPNLDDLVAQAQRQTEAEANEAAQAAIFEG